MDGRGGQAGRSGESSCPAEVDDDVGCVGDHPADLVEQAGGGGFGWVDVVAVLVAAHERVGVEPGRPIVIDRCEHFLVGLGGPVDVVNPADRHSGAVSGRSIPEHLHQRVSTALGIGPIQILFAQPLAEQTIGTQPCLGIGPVSLELGGDVSVEDLPQLRTLPSPKEPGQFPRQVEGVLHQADIPLLVVTFVWWLGTVLVDQAGPPVHLAPKRLRIHRLGIRQELLVALAQRRRHPRVGIHPAQRSDRTRRHLTRLPRRCHLRSVLGQPGRLRPDRRLSLGQPGHVADHDLGRPMPVGCVQHSPLNRPHQYRLGRINATTQPIELLDPYHRISRIRRVESSLKQLVHRQLRLSQRRPRSNIGHRRLRSGPGSQLIGGQPQSQRRQSATVT